MAEGIGAAAFLLEHQDDPFFESWYRNLWDVVARHHIDEQNGAWHEQLTEDMKPAYSLFAGKGEGFPAEIASYSAAVSRTRTPVDQASETIWWVVTTSRWSSGPSR